MSEPFSFTIWSEYLDNKLHFYNEKRASVPLRGKKTRMHEGLTFSTRAMC